MSMNQLMYWGHALKQTQRPNLAAYCANGMGDTYGAPECRTYLQALKDTVLSRNAGQEPYQLTEADVVG